MPASGASLADFPSRQSTPGPPDVRLIPPTLVSAKTPQRRRRTPIRIICLLAFALSAAAQASAAANDTRWIRFARGTASSTVGGVLEGDRIIDYKVLARNWQTVSVKLSAQGEAGRFDVLAPGPGDAVIFAGANGGTEWSGIAFPEGEYTIRVYLAEAAARHGATAKFSLAVSIAGRSRVPRALVRSLTLDAEEIRRLQGDQARRPQSQRNP
jgi:hypothetical protein